MREESDIARSTRLDTKRQHEKITSKNNMPMASRDRKTMETGQRIGEKENQDGEGLLRPMRRVAVEKTYLNSDISQVIWVSCTHCVTTSGSL